MSTLEGRIAAALRDDDITSQALGELLIEVEAGVSAADKAAAEARQRALDPTIAETSTARRETDDAGFRRDRLRSALPPLQGRYREVVAAEESGRWLPQHEAAKARRDALAARLPELYVPFLKQFVPLALEIEALNREIRRVNESAPRHGATGMHLDSVETAARGAEGLLRDIKLPAWEPNAKPAWPLHGPFDPTQITPGLGGDLRLYSADWWRVGEEEAQGRAAAAEREAAEREAKALESWHGPRWWELAKQ
jgi:hypothetical protein